MIFLNILLRVAKYKIQYKFFLPVTSSDTKGNLKILTDIMPKNHSLQLSAEKEKKHFEIDCLENSFHLA